MGEQKSVQQNASIDAVEKKTLEILTGQPVTLSLGGQSYTARRVTLYDIGLYEKYRRERIEKGDMVNIDTDAILFLLSELMKPWHPDMSAKNIALSIPLENMGDITTAVIAVGLKLPQQKMKKELERLEELTGEKSTPQSSNKQAGASTASQPSVSTPSQS